MSKSKQPKTIRDMLSKNQNSPLLKPTRLKKQRKQQKQQNNLDGEQKTQEKLENKQKKESENKERKMESKQRTTKHNKSFSMLTKRQKGSEQKNRNPSLAGVNFRNRRSKSRSHITSFKNRDEVGEKQSQEISKEPSKSIITNKNFELQPLNSKNSRNSTPLTILNQNSKKTIPEQIMDYIKKREDVEIIQYFEQYKRQFYTKSKMLHEYIYKSNEPQKVKNTYLNEGDSHFINGMEGIMLKLFRNGTIVPQSYTNLRQEAVEEIEKWVIGWIHRKINYGRLIDEQEDQVTKVENILSEMTNWRKQLYEQDTSF